MTKEQEDSIYAIKFAVMQQQIDKLKKHNDELLRKLRNRVKEVKKLEKYSLYKEEFSRLNKQLQNKEKIIDLMTEYISNITDCPFESENKYLDCEKMCDVREDKECWKKYFENKAKETSLKSNKKEIKEQTKNGRTDVYVLTSDLEELGYRNIKEDERQFINAYVLQDLIKRYEFKHNLKAKVEIEQIVEKINKEQNRTISDSWDEISK